MANFSTVREFMQHMDVTIVREDRDECVLVVDAPQNGIRNLVVLCDQPILIMHQTVVPVSEPSVEFYARILQLNAQLVHGAFVLDADAGSINWRHTLQLENLDFNELDAAVNALSLAMAEFAFEFVSSSRPIE